MMATIKNYLTFLGLLILIVGVIIFMVVSVIALIFVLKNFFVLFVIGLALMILGTEFIRCGVGY